MEMDCGKSILTKPRCFGNKTTDDSSITEKVKTPIHNKNEISLRQFLVILQKRMERKGHEKRHGCK